MKKMKVDRDFFFASVKKSLFGNKFNQTQIDGMNAILDACEAEDFDFKPYFAGPLATCYHETGRTMKPVREGFATSDAQARAAVAHLFARGKISKNYALPEANGLSYYGRGFPQLTHGFNYKAQAKRTGYDLYNNPDLMLRQDVSAKVLVMGMRYGDFTKKSMAYYAAGGAYDYYGSRAIINGDKNRIVKHGKVETTIGEMYERYCKKFEAAIRFVEVDVEPLPEKPLASTKSWSYTPGSVQNWFRKLFQKVLK